MPTLAQRIRTTPDAPARKPLYLLNREQASIDAGPDHLILRRKGATPQRFPLARICRIICSRQVDWSGAALTLCLREGIPITWVDGHGHALGNTQTLFPQPLPFTTLIDVYLELPDWPGRFANWCARRRLETLTTCAMRAAREGRHLEAGELEGLKRQYVYNGEHPLTFHPDGEGWCYALTVDRLHREGLQASYWGFGGTRLALAEELASLMWAELNIDCGNLPAGADESIVSARLFQSWAQQREARLLHHLDDFKRHLLRETETWH